MTRFLTILTLTLAALAAPQARAQLPSWSLSDAQDLLTVVDEAGREGLDPADYQAEALRRAIAGGQAEAISEAASRIFFHVADDFSQGHVRQASRLAWHIEGPVLSEASKQSLLSAALARHEVAARLRSLLPTNPEYARLKAALAETPPADRQASLRLRANLDRWRWMPRFLGRRYIMVNIPSFELTLVDDGRVIERHKIIVGKPRTPSPQFAATVKAVLLNPWWDVPPSIVAESVGRLVRTNPAAARSRGYVVATGHIRQRPGPQNSLGQMKLEMTNPYKVYVHDTPSKELFEQDVRAFSHGCIRTQDPYRLAETLLAGRPEWTRDAIDAVVQSRITTEARLVEQVPIYVTYFTAISDANGAVAVHPDIYGRDRPVLAALGGRAAPLPPRRKADD